VKLPNAHVYIDGDVEGLSKGGTFVGQHLYVPREGAAVHINAFNFPVWGMLEKLAPTILAGMPAIVKTGNGHGLTSPNLSCGALLNRRYCRRVRCSWVCGRLGRSVRSFELPGHDFIYGIRGKTAGAAAHSPGRHSALGAVHRGKPIR